MECDYSYGAVRNERCICDRRLRSGFASFVLELKFHITRIIPRHFVRSSRVVQLTRTPH